MKLEADIAVVGSGFGGSLTSLVARRLGLSVVLLERGSHPRFAIGESSSPLANILLETLADRYELPRAPATRSPTRAGTGAFGLGESRFQMFPETEALYAPFREVRRRFLRSP